MTDGGTYTLVLAVPADCRVEIGALGSRRFPAGGYAYTGSALGPGGFSRIDRHRRIAAGERDVRHWHVDYLLGRPETDLRDIVRTPGADVECAVASRLRSASAPAPGFGASDCDGDCGAHLARRESVAAARRAAVTAHREAAARDPIVG